LLLNLSIYNNFGFTFIVLTFLSEVIIIRLM